jgi:hypothetical protein
VNVNTPADAVGADSPVGVLIESEGPDGEIAVPTVRLDPACKKYEKVGLF